MSSVAAVPKKIPYLVEMKMTGTGGTLRKVTVHDKKSMVWKRNSGGKQFRDYTKSKIKVFTFLNKYYMLLSYFTYLLLLKNHLHDCILTLKSRKTKQVSSKSPRQVA